MAQIQTTLKVSLDEANLLLKLLDEGEEHRQNLGKALIVQIREGTVPPNADYSNHPDYPKYQLMGQEVLAIQALRRGLRGAR